MKTSPSATASAYTPEPEREVPFWRARSFKAVVVLLPVIVCFVFIFFVFIASLAVEPLGQTKTIK